MGFDGIGDFFKNTGRAIADGIAHTKLGASGIEYVNNYMKVTDNEIADVIKKAAMAANNADSAWAKAFSEAGLTANSSTDAVKTIWTGMKESEAINALNLKKGEEISKEAIDKINAKVSKDWKTIGYSNYFNGNSDITKKRVKGVAIGAAGTYIAGSVVHRALGPGTITRDEYGNRDIMGIPFF